LTSPEYAIAYQASTISAQGASNRMRDMARGGYIKRSAREAAAEPNQHGSGTVAECAAAVSLREDMTLLD
jgi:hypothetical protein